VSRSSATDRAFSDVDLATLLSGENAAYLEPLFEDYLADDRSVPPMYAELFDTLLGRRSPARPMPPRRAPTPVATPRPWSPPAPDGVFGLVDAYRTYGHLIANLDPLEAPPTSHPFLDPAEFGITGAMLDTPVGGWSYLGLDRGTPRELIASLQRTYCGSFAVEFMDQREKSRRDWLIQQMEPIENHLPFTLAERHRILREVIAAERFEQFLHKRFLGQKRFSAEGGDAMVPMLNEIVEEASAVGVDELVIAMAHRGRLNVLTHVVGMPYRAIFAEFQKGLVPVDAQGSGDVKYHRGFSSDRVTRVGRNAHLSLCPNPSHLEVINPVAEGMVRAKQNIRGDLERMRVVPLLIHGDASFTGQGIVAETLAMSKLEAYWTGGTIHLIVNNRIGFTTEPHEYRFTRHPSDMARAIQAPIFHVNADDPEACVHAARLAIDFRQHFHEDVIINLVCYRRHGHNEGDDPSYTQPLMYEKIAAQPTAATLYTERLLREGAITQDEVDALEKTQRERLEGELDASHMQVLLEGAQGYHGLWKGYQSERWTTSLLAADAAADTSVSRATIERVATAIDSMPTGFTPHKKVRGFMEQRARLLRDREPLDWGAAEALAFGSLLSEGTTIRLTGQDSERATFSHRHAVLHDVKTGERHIPLQSVAQDGATFIIANSLLSEAAVLGFEYGYSSVDPTRLTIWEAQYGDFVNGAQVIIDQFISAAEQKWNRSSGLVMLLPHGYEGHGPEHSSARLERFLQLCAEDNMQVVNLTTPAQIFHAYRRQILRQARKPLIVMSPKSLLRHPKCLSPHSEFERGGFREVIDDPARYDGRIRPERVRRVVLCSGKVYYALDQVREEHRFDDVALVRIEQLHPFPFGKLREILPAYGGSDYVWVQEEPWNMGAWTFVQDRLGHALPRDARVRYVGRAESASPATGSYRVHEQEEAEFLREAFAQRPRLPVA
jgi:2-oxoglutarate dehydrogenase E1 component